MNKELLNKVKDMLIAKASEDGRDLAKDFGTKEEFKKFVIAFAIRSCQENLGMSVSEAYDTVMGAGSYQRLADECFNKLQNA